MLYAMWDAACPFTRGPVKRDRRVTQTNNHDTAAKATRRLSDLDPDPKAVAQVSTAIYLIPLEVSLMATFQPLIAAGDQNP